MDVIAYNISWMGFNIFLAFVAVLLGWLLRRTTWKFLQIPFGIAWLLFLPNTLYLITDIIHYDEGIDYVTGVYRIIFILQYVVLLLLGIVTYFAALYPIEKTFVRGNKWLKLLFILIINLLVGFGMTLGRVARVNSWDILSNIHDVVEISTYVITTKSTLILVLLFTIIGIIIYAFMRIMIKKCSTVFV